MGLSAANMDVSWNEACEMLRDLRDTSVRDSELVVDLGEKLIRKHASKLHDEVWLICEQVFIASIDICRFDVAEMCLDKLRDNFPHSARVRKLEAMGLEAQGKFEDAKDIYDQMEKEDETDAAIRKRKIALLKAQGKTTDAVKSLTNYLQTFMADQEAWMELAELYIKLLDYKKAAFCLEELILANSFNHLYHQRYAEVMYSMGGGENHEIARQYFAQAVKLSSNTNIRALYGLLLTSAKLPTTKVKNSKQHASWAAKTISAKYENVWCTGNATDAGYSESKITPKKDLPQLTASVERMMGQLSLGTESSEN